MELNRRKPLGLCGNVGWDTDMELKVFNLGSGRV